MPILLMEPTNPPRFCVAGFVDTPCAALKTFGLGQGTDGADA